MAPAAAQAGRTAERLADQAVAALLDEVHLSPKPGLVDGRGNGAHRDLNLALMCRSAHALRPGFVAMAEATQVTGAPTAALRRALGRLGRDTEAAMLDATGGVNTHRGAIWALGLLVAAAALDAGNDDSVTTTPDTGDAAAGADGPVAGDGFGIPPAARRIATTAGALARLADPGAPVRTGHNGEMACRRYHVGGARGQARAGFPQVVGVALPALTAGRARGDGETAARLNALVALIAGLDDTCVLSRAGAAGLARLQAGAAAVTVAGGVATLAGRRALRMLDADALALGASPGGAADLLAAALFLDRLR